MPPAPGCVAIIREMESRGMSNEPAKEKKQSKRTAGKPQAPAAIDANGVAQTLDCSATQVEMQRQEECKVERLHLNFKRDNVVKQLAKDDKENPAACLRLLRFCIIVRQESSVEMAVENGRFDLWCWICRIAPMLIRLGRWG